MTPLQLTQHPDMQAATRKLEAALAEYNSVKMRLAQAHGGAAELKQTSTLRFTNLDGIERMATIVLTDC